MTLAAGDCDPLISISTLIANLRPFPLGPWTQIVAQFVQESDVLRVLGGQQWHQWEVMRGRKYRQRRDLFALASYLI